MYPKGMLSDRGNDNIALGGEVVHAGDEIHLIDAAGKVIHAAKNDDSKPRDSPRPNGEATALDQWMGRVHALMQQ